jgi:hypothetical protein
MATQIELPTAKEMQVRQPTTMSLMLLALETGKVEQLQILQEMHFKELARSAEVEFNLAMNAAQTEIIRVVPDAYNQQTKSKWATYAALDKMLRPIYTKHNFSLSFDSGESPAETVIARCYVSHGAGHTRKYQSPPMPLPTMGAQGKAVMTATHGTGAAMSYAKRYLLTFIFNIPVGEDDTDGNGPGPQMDQDELKERLAHFPKCDSFDELEQHFRASYMEAKKAKDQGALDAVIMAKNTRKEQLRKAGAQ